jgi:hypothetical protein
MKLSKTIFLVALVAAFFILAAKISLAAEAVHSTSSLTGLTPPLTNYASFQNGRWVVDVIDSKGVVVKDWKPEKMPAPTLPNFFVYTVTFNFEHGGYYADVIIQNAGAKVIDNLTVNLKYGGQTYSQTIISDCHYYMCGANFGPLSNVTNANLEVDIDPENHFAESNKADNVYIQKKDLADFTITGMKAVRKGWNYFVDVTVKNIGNAINGPIVAKGVPNLLAVGLEDNLGNYYVPQKSINELYFPKNFTRVLEFGPLINPKKINTLKATVDRTGMITELNENNNAKQINFHK